SRSSCRPRRGRGSASHSEYTCSPPVARPRDARAPFPPADCAGCLRLTAASGFCHAPRASQDRLGFMPEETKYKVLEELGAGGMGKVFKGLLIGQAGFQRPIVIKKLRDAQDAGHVQLFVDEARR